jgi:UDP-4-amino-4,6-dideoxy-N-acetyl-beta-L-altrosamine transaminase
MTGAPTANSPRLPYGRQWIEEDDVAAVTAALRSEMIAHGPRTREFEDAFAAAVGASEAVAVASGTAALHLAYLAQGLGPNDRCVVPAITFLSTATAAIMCGAIPVFADVDPETGLLTPQSLEAVEGGLDGVRLITPVHLGGRLCDMDALAKIAEVSGAKLIEDASHAVGGYDQAGAPVGACRRAVAATFSFHPVKTLAAGEGGMVSLNDPSIAARLRRLRNHGVTRDAELLRPGSFDAEKRPLPWIYEQLELGFNYRMNEMEAALGLSQLAKLTRFVTRRSDLAARYEALLAPLHPLVRPAPSPVGRPGLHLFSILIDFEAAGVSRGAVMRALEAVGVGTQVHYIPLYRQPFFEARLGKQRLAGAEAYYRRTLSLPLYPKMSDEDPARVVDALADVLRR